jgi:hypothetical protein
MPLEKHGVNQKSAKCKCLKTKGRRKISRSGHARRFSCDPVLKHLIRLESNQSKIEPMKRVLLGMAAICYLAAQEPDSAVIRARGCLAPGVEGGCATVKDQKTGQIYTVFFGSQEAPKGNRAIAFRGVEHRGMTTCMQGKAVDVSKWSYIKVRCPKITEAPPQ